MNRQKYITLAEVLKYRILQGRYESKLLPQRDLLDEFDVSSRTLSRAIAELVRDGYATSSRLGVVIAQCYRPIRSDRFIGIVIPFRCVIAPEQEPLISVLLTLIGRDGYHPVIISADDHADRLINDTASWNICGYIFTYGSYYLGDHGFISRKKAPLVITNMLDDDARESWIDFAPHRYAGVIEQLRTHCFSRIWLVHGRAMPAPQLRHWQRLAAELNSPNAAVMLVALEDALVTLHSASTQAGLPDVIVPLGVPGALPEALTHHQNRIRLLLPNSMATQHRDTLYYLGRTTDKMELLAQGAWGLLKNQIDGQPLEENHVLLDSEIKIFFH